MIISWREFKIQPDVCMSTEMERKGKQAPEDGHAERFPEEGGDAGNVLVVAERRRLVSEFESALRPRYDVWTATSGKQALDIVDNDVDIVVVAPRTTDMDGAEVVARTRERGIGFGAVVVDEEAGDMFDGRVPTPVTEEKIVASVEGVLEGQKRRVFGREFGDDNPVERDYESWEESSVKSSGDGGFAAF